MKACFACRIFHSELCPQIAADQLPNLVNGTAEGQAPKIDLQANSCQQNGPRQAQGPSLARSGKLSQ